MISLKSPREIDLMRKAGAIAGAARALAGKMVAPGVTTGEIDAAVRAFIEGQGATPSFLNYNGFPGSACISVNEQVIHGIPGGRKLLAGDIVSVDVGACYHGFHGDCAGTYPCGEISAEARYLIEVTEGSFWAGIANAKPGNRVYDISHAVQQYVEERGCSVVRDFVGHGVGAKLHEPPEVPNFGPAGHGPRLQAGMTIAVEPMVNAGGFQVTVLKDGWTTVTADGSLAAHYENSILITEGEPEILTAEGKL
ncbi:MAG: type I methionyl aminopeptidase [Oscillospiraceae bacterium]|nr:type I methionyl aminopeptidase [Oscillospiraceae bacterium]